MAYYGRVAFLVLFSALLSACGHKSEGNTQVVAKVNGDEITVYQLNYAMSRVGNIPKGGENEAEKQVLKSLVDQQLLVKLATDKKLDRNPNVLQAIEASKSQILAQAALEQLVQPLLTKPTDTEIHDYFVKTPELFANRRIYKFIEVSIASKTPLEKIKSMLSGAKSLDEFFGKLRKEDIEFKTATVVKPAEELPTVLLPKFFKMAKGEVAIVPAGDSVSVLQLQDFQEQPVTEEQAKPLIGKYLLEQNRKTLLEAELKKLRDSAKIEYLGAFAGTAKSLLTPASAVSAAATTTDTGKADSAKDNDLKKGLSGLK